MAQKKKERKKQMTTESHLIFPSRRCLQRKMQQGKHSEDQTATAAKLNK